MYYYEAFVVSLTCTASRTAAKFQNFKMIRVPNHYYLTDLAKAHWKGVSDLNHSLKAGVIKAESVQGFSLSTLSFVGQ